MQTSKPVSKLLTSIFIIPAMIGLASCGSNTETEETHHDSTMVHDGALAVDSSATFQTAAGTISGTTADTSVSGTVRFEKQSDSKVKMNLDISVEKMANKSVAVHLHEHAECGDHGNHAGGHWNPTGEDHGKWGEGKYHSGDFGNIKLDGAGKGTLELVSDRWTLGGTAGTNVIGRTVVVHSGTDDYKTQPSGNSGSRIGCGVISNQ